MNRELVAVKGAGNAERSKKKKPTLNPYKPTEPLLRRISSFPSALFIRGLRSMAQPETNAVCGDKCSM